MLYLKSLQSLLKRDTNEPTISIDIGSSSVKVISIDTGAHRPKLLGAGVAPTPAGAVTNNTISRPEQIAGVIRSIMSSHDIIGSKATFSLPGSAVFTKKITIGYQPLKDLSANISFEASNYIPHSIDAVHLDYQVLHAQGKSTMDVLLVAVKNEVLRGYLASVEQAGLEPVIADVDYFAVENMFELNYPEEKTKTLALINIGARHSTVSIVQGGKSLFTGDVGVGGRLYTDALCETLGMQPAQAEQAKAGVNVAGFDESIVHETRDRTTEHLASELHRQLGFFWNAAATDKAIEGIFVCGGGAQVPGLVEEVSAKTGTNCQLMKTFRNIDWTEQFDEEYVGEIGLSLGVGVGLGIRRPGDKRHAIE